MTPLTRVGFFTHRGYHEAVLRRVADALGDRLPSIVSGDQDEIVHFRPDILVLPGFWLLEWFRAALPETIIGSVRHGLVSKRGVQRLPERAAARTLDFVCIGDPATAERYRRQGALPTEFWFTGYPQLDPLFRHDPPTDCGLDPQQPTVLYAPTWNRYLSSAAMLGDRLVSAIRGAGPALNILIKPHPTTPDWRPKWMAWWSRAAHRDPRVRLLDPRSDVTAAMLAADLLVSDASSTIFEFMALDRPIVLVTNPDASRDNDYDPDDIIWRWRDVGAEVHDVNDLAAAVASGLADPARRKAERARYANELFGALRDGHNASRVARGLVDLAARIDAGTGPRPAAAVDGVPKPRPRRRARRSLPRRLLRSIRERR